jgi:hypothetical protein
MSSYQEFPKALQPAAGSDDEPVIVNSPGEEAGFLARGYRLLGASDRQSYENQMLGALPETYVPERFPMWIGEVLVHNEAEEGRVRAQLIETPEAAVSAEVEPASAARQGGRNVARAA